MSYGEKIISYLEENNRGQSEFLQASRSFIRSIEPVLNAHPEYQNAALLERLVEPERLYVFRVPWVDDRGKVRVNRGYRIQFNSAIGPYKGGLRFHPSVNLSVVKFLAFEQIFKNSLTSLPIGAGKGGCNFNPKGKSDNEIMHFCQSFMTSLYRVIGEDTDVPAGDVGVGSKEIGYLFGQYKRITNKYVGVLTGKGLSYGGSLARTEATGYGLIYFVQALLESMDSSLHGKNVVISGSGNVAIYAVEKAFEMGAKVLTVSDSSGFVYDKDGIDIEILKEIKEKKRDRIYEYVNHKKTAEYFPGQRPWNIPCDVALPCATQNEILIDDAKELCKNGCILVAEGANMPTTPEAIKYFQNNKIIFGPAKAANAGGVSVSALEMSQNSQRMSKSFVQVDKLLENIMENIYYNIADAAEEYNDKGNLVLGANAAGFLKVADAMMAQGVV
ncbi:MAG: NADP-specific glutamate dehydrogenase [Clostridia bacterium]|nr:NADP-specific glutamate dehydrogenase [Clostridia bacterium]